MTHRHRTRQIASALLCAVSFAAASSAASQQADTVAPLPNPPLETALAALHPGADSGFRFFVLGDQRAIPDDERRALARAMDSTASSTPRVLFFLDTGDIIDDGRRAEQFGMLSRLIAPVARLPFLLGVGNHEVSNNRPGSARASLASYLRPVDPSLTPNRLYYRKDVGPARFLFLDSNDLVYGDRGDREGDTAPLPGSRGETQLDWLARQLADSSPTRPRVTIVAMHHPLVQSSSKHRQQARSLWRYRYHGRTLADLFADGRVVLVLAAHTHSYERCTLTRADGRHFVVLNVSGRPRPSFLCFGAGARRAHDLEGREHEWLTAQGWSLDDWTVTQDEVMTDNEANQFVMIDVDATGGLAATVHWLGRDHGPRTRLR